MLYKKSSKLTSNSKQNRQKDRAQKDEKLAFRKNMYKMQTYINLY